VVFLALASAAAQSTLPESAAAAVSASGANTVLEAALSATGLDAQLADPAFEGTVFAPNDAAFAALLAKLGLSREELLAEGGRRALTARAPRRFPLRAAPLPPPPLPPAAGFAGAPQ
jgi:hypothetical protein